MLRPKKNISKRDLKEDVLVSTYVKLTSFYDTNKRAISIGVTAVVVSVFAVVIFLKNRSENNEKAITALGAIFETYDAGQFQKSVDGIPEKNIQGLKSIVDNYGGSATGDLARFYLANAYSQLGRYDEALKEFEDYSPSGELLSVSRLSGIGSCYEAKSMFKEAAASFEKAATQYPKDVSAAENLNNAARDYGQSGDREKAIELYKRIKKNYPTTAFARDADRYIAQLSV
ncbi:MAG TPA: tetratricopeptide repeat protein [Bacteroidota bacterium]